MYDSFVSYFSLVLIVAIPLIITALGAMFSERSGVVNIAMEGIMVVGAFVGILFVNGKFVSEEAARNATEFSELMGGPLITYTIGMLVAVLAGMAVSYLHALASIKMKADQIISATAINTFTPALALFLTMTLSLARRWDPSKNMFVGEGSDQLPVASNLYKIGEVPLLSKIPVLGDLFFTNTYLGLYIGIAILIAAYIIVYRTKFGLRLRACGENPHAADAAGINIYKMRYTGVLISGGLAGLSGYIFILGNNVKFFADVSGYGFLAIAVLIFGNWKPFRIMGAAFLFAALLQLSKGIAFFPALEGLGIDENILSMLPYVATIIILVLTSKNSRAPKAAGQVFDKGER